METATPSSYMFADLKRFAGLSNRDVARIVLTDRPILEGVSPRDRADERTFLSREIVHADPGYLPATFFVPFDVSAQAVSGRMVARLGTGARIRIEEHYARETADEFCAVLRAWGINDALYANALNRISSVRLASEQSRCTLYVLLFMATACLGDPLRAVDLAERFAIEKLGSGFSTQTVELGLGERPVEQAAMRLGLARVVGGKMTGAVHPLSCGAEGTVIGSLAADGDAIVDVENDVSRRHLRIWREGGHWYAQGLDSTNGTAVVSGDDRGTRVIEPPRRRRGAGWRPEPCEILPGDVLMLGASTRFLVLELAE